MIQQVYHSTHQRIAQELQITGHAEYPKILIHHKLITKGKTKQPKPKVTYVYNNTHKSVQDQKEC
jgi:hypothetical protein